MILRVDRSDHEIIWLPDGDEVPDREKHMIHNPKLMLTFVWNPYGFQVVDAMPYRKETSSRPLTISEIFSPKSSLGVEWRERQEEVHVACGQCKATYSTSDKSILR
jgi:hypothetical protein